jgi:riboflavin kinase/FMN adenylyltransferase
MRRESTLQVIRGSQSIGRALASPVLTVGNFDGLHLGHQAILRKVVERARALGGEAVVFTFDPHPRKVLRPEQAPRLLTTLEQKLELLALAGADVVIVEPFSAAFARTPAEVFIREVLHARIRPVEVYVGYDFHFGRDRAGSMRMLTELGPHLGFAVTIVPEVTIDSGDVNSTRIRQVLADSDPEGAAAMLGRPYTVRGRIVEGSRRGRSLGFPTANLDPENEVLPAAGVYAGELRLLDAGDPPSGAAWPVVTNVGVRPTFEGPGGVVAEAHLIGFEGDLYGRRVDLSFRFHLREERRFPGVEALVKQIAADVAEARRRLGTV